MTEYPPTSPVYSWPLLEGDQPNDWRDIDQALVAVEQTVAAVEALATAPGAVTSVNGETGAVVLDAADVGALTQAAADVRYEPLDSAYTKGESDAKYALTGHTHPSEESGPWRFQDTAGGTPGAGYLRTNTGALIGAGQLVISRTTQDGYDIPPPGWGVVAGDTIYVQDRDDSTKWVRYVALEPLVRFATYATGLVTETGHAGAVIANGQIVQVTFSLAGGGGGGAGGVVATDALWDAKGDLAGGTGANTAARLAVGTNGTFLSADSAQATGLAWAANPVTAHTALPNAHHAQAHDHTAADGSGTLTNDTHDGYSQYANLGADAATPATNQIRLYSKDNGSGVATLYYRTENGDIYELPTLGTGGGNGSGAPSNASYITTTAENKLSQEKVLGTAVIMSGVLSGRPAFGTAGRLYLATDTDLVYRDTGSAWETFATRAAGGGGLATDPLADAKGDLFAASANNAVGRLAAGTDGQVLTADSAQTLGVKWAAGGMADPTTAKGDLIVRDTASGTGSPKHLNPVPGGPRTDATGITYGTSFSTSTNGYITELKFYRYSLSTTHHAVTLWSRASTLQIAGSTTSSEWAGYGSVGWATYTLPTPVAVATGVTYTVTSTYTGQATDYSGNTSADSPLAYVGRAYSSPGATPTYPNTQETLLGYAGIGVDVTYVQTLTAAAPTRLPVGTNGYVLTADSAQTLGVKWNEPVTWTVAGGSLTTSATAGAASALPGAPAGYLTVVINGTSRKLAFWAT